MSIHQVIVTYVDYFCCFFSILFHVFVRILKEKKVSEEKLVKLKEKITKFPYPVSLHIPKPPVVFSI